MSSSLFYVFGVHGEHVKMTVSKFRSKSENVFYRNVVKVVVIMNVEKNYRLKSMLNELNITQKQSVLSDDNTLQILAGPGSGKTKGRHLKNYF